MLGIGARVLEPPKLLGGSPRRNCRWGVMSQCVQASNVVKNQPRYCSNMWMKFRVLWWSRSPRTSKCWEIEVGLLAILPNPFRMAPPSAAKVDLVTGLLDSFFGNVMTFSTISLRSWSGLLAISFDPLSTSLSSPPHVSTHLTYHFLPCISFIQLNSSSFNMSKRHLPPDAWDSWLARRLWGREYFPETRNSHDLEQMEYNFQRIWSSNQICRSLPFLPPLPYIISLEKLH